MTQIKQLEEKLKAPFAAADIEYRVVRVSKDSRKALVLPYITSRAVMDRLDNVFGCEKWTDEYQILPNGVTCKLSAKLNGDFITKQDAAPFTHIEALKGAFSDALKRAAVKFGIGRYLYKIPESYVNILPQRPNNARGRLRYYHSTELSGWWIEPEIVVEDTTGDDKPVKAETAYTQLKLPQKLKLIHDLGLITDKNYQDISRKIADKTTGQGLLRYFQQQLDLLHNLHNLAISNKVKAEQRAQIYKRIMSSKMSGFAAIETELKNLREAA